MATRAQGEVVGLVLCAGLGTRLRPLTDRVPKPAAPVGGVPLVQWALALLAGAGVRRVVVNTHHLAGEMAGAARRAAEAVGVALEVSHEPAIAGTGGALREARRFLSAADELLVLNGDVLFDVDLAAALAAHRRSGALASMVLMPMPAGATYNAVEVDRAGLVRRIARDFGPGGEGLAPFHFSGVHVMSRAVLDAVPAEPFESDVNRKVYPALMERGQLRAQVVEGYWNDLGTPERYLAANRDLLAGKVPLGRFQGADPYQGLVERERGLWVAPGAVTDGAVLRGPVLIRSGAGAEAGAEVGPGVVLGEGAWVEKGAAVRDAVIWAGTRVKEGERVEGGIAAGELRVKG